MVQLPEFVMLATEVRHTELMNATTHRGLYNYRHSNLVRLRELALKADSRRKIPCHTRELNWLQQCIRSGAESTELHPNHQSKALLGLSLIHI